MNVKKYKESEDETTNALGVALELSRMIRDLKPGTEFITPCPLCGGKITAIKSIYNFHLHAKCDTCNFLMME